MAKTKKLTFGAPGLQKRKPVKPVAPSGGGRRHKGGGGLGALTDPSTLLSGRKLGKSAGALTRIELLPALQAYGRQVESLKSQQAGAAQGLEALGGRTAGAVGSVYDTLGASSDRTSARAQVIANMLNQNTQNIATQNQQALTNAQTGELGGLTEALTSRNVPPGGSASQAALANQVQAQQQAAATRAQGYQNYASSQGASMTNLASAEGQAEQMRGREAQAGIHQAILDRIASSNSDYAPQINEALGKQADTKALWGSTKLKNLLQLRGSERDFLNAQASLKGQNQRALLSSQTSRRGQDLTRQSSREGHDITAQHNQVTEQQGHKRLQQGGKRIGQGQQRIQQGKKRLKQSAKK